MASSKKEALLSFIKAYKSLPELWDTEDPSYCNRVKKAAAYDIIVEKLKILEPGATRDSVVKKINNLRSSFRKELKKVNDSKNSGSSTDDVYTPTLWYYQELMFLVQHETPDPSDSTIREINECSEDSLTPLPPTVIASSLVPPSKKKKLNSTSTAAQDFLAKATRYLETEDDESMTLAKAYATKLRKLTPQQFMFADKLINEVLLDAQLNFLTRSSYLVHPSGGMPVESSTSSSMSSSHAPSEH